MDDLINKLKNGIYDELCDKLEKQLLSGPYDETSIDLYLMRASRLLESRLKKYNLLSSQNEEFNIYAMYNLHQEYSETYSILKLLEKVKEENEDEYSEAIEIMFDNIVSRYIQFLDKLTNTLEEKFKFDSEKFNKKLDKSINHKWKTRFGQSGIDIKYRHAIDINKERERRNKK